MGSYTFKWEHPAEEVFVTGTFDDWTKSEQLVKVGDVFQKTVPLKDATQKIYFKYVVDGNWTVNESAPKEADHEGNINNFITPEDILQSDPAAALLNTVTPQSTTAAMASEQPIDKTEGAATPSDLPGGFPVTPSTELDKPIGVNPLPAAAGAVNPFKLEPGEKVPDVGIESTNDHVKLDKESYEKSDALPGVDIADLPPITSNLIPESSLPVTAAADVNINTVGSGATTLGLAAQVPLEAKIPDATTVPEVVKESQEKAHVAPEAAGVPEEVAGKAKVEEELKEKVTEAPATSEGTAGVGTEKSESDADPAAAIAAAAATTGAAVVAAVAAAKDHLVETAVPAAIAAKDNLAETAVPAVIAAKDNLVETAAPIANEAAAAASAAANDAVAAAAEAAQKNLPDSVKEKLPEPVQEILAQQETAAKEQTREEVSPQVPAEVKESIVEAGKSPEAAANTVAVEEKKEVEAELLKEVKPVLPVGETKTEEVSPEVPAEVKESITEAGKSPEAAANTVAVEDKKEVEAELLKEVKPVPPVEDAKPVAEVPVTSATITDVQAIDSPVTEVSNVHVSKTEVPVEELATVAPVIEEPKASEVPKAETLQTEVPKTETPTAEAVISLAPAAEVPALAPAPIDTTVGSEAPKTDEPAADTPVTETDKTEVPPSDAAAEPTKGDAANGANGAHSDKGSEKKKNRFSAFFSRFRHKH